MNDTAPEASGTPDERRCWRCLRMFPRHADGGTATRDEFWLCDPCEAALLPSRTAPTTHTRSSRPTTERGAMADKSPRQHQSKKSGKSLKEKRRDKKAKQATKPAAS